MTGGKWQRVLFWWSGLGFACWLAPGAWAARRAPPGQWRALQRAPTSPPWPLSMVHLHPPGAALDPAGLSPELTAALYLFASSLRQGSRGRPAWTGHGAGLLAWATPTPSLPACAWGWSCRRALSTGEGFLDGFIESYHRALGLAQRRAGSGAPRPGALQCHSMGRRIVSQDGSTRRWATCALTGPGCCGIRRGPGSEPAGPGELPRRPGQGPWERAGHPPWASAADLPLGRFALNANLMYFHLGSTSLWTPGAEDVVGGQPSLGGLVRSVHPAGPVNGANALVQDTGWRAWTTPMLQLLLGGCSGRGQKPVLSLAFSEDLVHYTSPDFTLSLSWGMGGLGSRGP